MGTFKSEKKASNLICRVSNATPEMVCRYVERLPKQPMSESAFREIMGSSWFQNEHQAPEQWGLYYIDGKNYYPRFDRNISLGEAHRYLLGWMKRLIVINPYTRFRHECDKPLVKSMVQFMENNPSEHDLKTIIKGVIETDEPFLINDIIANALNNYSEIFKVTTIDKDNELFNISLINNYKEIINKKYNMTKQEYFDSFNDISLVDPQDQPLQQIYYGAPGTGKSHDVKIQTGELDASGNKQEKLNVFRTTFHPDTDYATFVGCYKPTMKPVAEKYRAVAGKEEEIVYEFVPQAFTDAYIYAYNHTDTQTYLVIEEINRGNCAQIFGDLFQLLDRKADGTSEYTIKADKDLANYLITKLGNDSEGIKDGKLRLPANLNILATMNTSDQSLFPIDSAFKRRWDWEYMPIKYSNTDWKIDIAGTKYNWVDFQKEINKRVFDATDSEDKQLGDYFVKADANNIISAKLLLNKVIFYLWNDVCKDGDGDIFKINTDLDYTKELDPANNEDITFSQFFENTNLKLQQWMRYLDIKPN